MSGWKIVGINDDSTTCEVCGRIELKRTVHLVMEDGSELRAGTTCAARKLSVPSKVVRDAADGYIKRLEATKDGFECYYRHAFNMTVSQCIEKYGQDARKGIYLVYVQYMKKYGFSV